MKKLPLLLAACAIALVLFVVMSLNILDPAHAVLSVVAFVLVGFACTDLCACVVRNAGIRAGVAVARGFAFARRPRASAGTAALLALALAYTLTGGMLAACSTLKTLTPAQIATTLCAPTKVAIGDFNAFSKLYAAVPAVQTGETILTKYQPVVDAVCAEGATVTASNLQDLITQGIPAVAAIVATVPMPVATQAAIQGGFAAAELVVNMVGLYENALSTAQASVAAGAPAESVVLAAKMSVKVPQQ